MLLPNHWTIRFHVVAQSGFTWSHNHYYLVFYNDEDKQLLIEWLQLRYPYAKKHELGTKVEICSSYKLSRLAACGREHVVQRGHEHVVLLKAGILLKATFTEYDGIDDDPDLSIELILEDDPNLSISTH